MATTRRTKKPTPKPSLPAALEKNARASRDAKRQRLADAGFKALSAIKALRAKISDDFLEMGRALQVLKSKGVADAMGWGSFEALCAEKLDLSVTRADLLIELFERLTVKVCPRELPPRPPPSLSPPPGKRFEALRVREAVLKADNSQAVMRPGRGTGRYDPRRGAVTRQASDANEAGSHAGRWVEVTGMFHHNSRGSTNIRAVLDYLAATLPRAPSKH